MGEDGGEIGVDTALRLVLGPGDWEDFDWFCCSAAFLMTFWVNVVAGSGVSRAKGSARTKGSGL